MHQRTKLRLFFAQMANVRANQTLLARARAEYTHAAALAAKARMLLGSASDPFVRANIERASTAF